MFGIDDMISGLVGGSLKMLANDQQNKFAQASAEKQQQWTMENQARSEAYNASQAGISRDFNAQQADVARQFSASQQLQAEDYNASQAELNRQFQERMSSSAYQRSRADMLKAGLNPILAANAGGASTPGGSGGSIGAVSGPSASAGAASVGAAPGARIGDRASLIEGAISAASEAARLEPTINLLKQTGKTAVWDTQKREAETLGQRAVTNLTEQQEAESRARTDKELSSKRNIEADTINKIDEANRIKLFGSEFNPLKTPRVLNQAWERQGGFKGVDANMSEFSSSAVSWMRGVLGAGTGGM